MDELLYRHENVATHSPHIGELQNRWRSLIAFTIWFALSCSEHTRTRGMAGAQTGLPVMPR